MVLMVTIPVTLPILWKFLRNSILLLLLALMGLFLFLPPTSLSNHFPCHPTNISLPCPHPKCFHLFWHVSIHLEDCMVSQSRRQPECSLLWKPENLHIWYFHDACMLLSLTDWLLNWCWLLAAQWFMDPSPMGPMTTFYCVTGLGAFKLLFAIVT